jgi:hypothetical protein
MNMTVHFPGIPSTDLLPMLANDDRAHREGAWTRWALVGELYG